MEHGYRARKTDVLVINTKTQLSMNQNMKQGLLNIDGKSLPQVKKKKVLGVIIDEDLNFKEHIDARVKSGHKALSSIGLFCGEKKGCSQEIFMNLYRSLVLPVLEYGTAAVATAFEYAEKELGKVQRKAMLMATGCMASTATVELEVLTNIAPIQLHLKSRHAEELVRIVSKVDDNLLKKEFMSWLSNPGSRRTCIFKSLLAHYNEIAREIDFEQIETDYKFTPDGGFYPGRQVNYIKDAGEQSNTKDIQVENIEAVLAGMKEDSVCAFTDGSALGNPGPTGAGACIYMSGLQSVPIQLKRPVGPHSNNYVGEIHGLHLALQFLLDDKTTGKEIHVFVDCQPALNAIFSEDLPKKNMALVAETRQILHSLTRTNRVITHWTPGHKKIEGNENADKLAKEAAKEVHDNPQSSDYDKKKE